MEKPDFEKAFKLWNDGLLDKEIAEILNCKEKRITAWRNQNDYPTNRGIFSWDKMGFVDSDKRGYVKHDSLRKNTASSIQARA